MAREQFIRELQAVQSSMLVMASMVEKAIQRSVNALKNLGTSSWLRRS